MTVREDISSLFDDPAAIVEHQLGVLINHATQELLPLHSVARQWLNHAEGGHWQQGLYFHGHPARDKSSSADQEIAGRTQQAGPH
jgi:hypothetical protein